MTNARLALVVHARIVLLNAECLGVSAPGRYDRFRSSRPMGMPFSLSSGSTHRGDILAQALVREDRHRSPIFH